MKQLHAGLAIVAAMLIAGIAAATPILDPPDKMAHTFLIGGGSSNSVFTLSNSTAPQKVTSAIVLSQVVLDYKETETFEGFRQASDDHFGFLHRAATSLSQPKVSEHGHPELFEVGLSTETI